MSLSSALQAGVSGLVAQGSRIASISDNVSNINTIGYKSGDTDFSTLVGSGIGAGGVVGKSRKSIDSQGLISSTGNTTDVAISGNGFFAVNKNNSGDGDFLYTRAGSFQRDSRGFLKNSGGFYLHAWKLDSEGRLPGAQGNITNTKSSSLLDSTEAVNVANIGGVAAATSLVELGLNLNAAEKIYEGAGLKAEIPVGDTLNRNRPGKSILVPATGLVADTSQFRISTGGGLVYNYTYGGYERSNDITLGALGATTVTGVFTGATTGDRFTITTASAGTVTFEFNSTAPNPALGKFNSMQTLSDAINEINGLSSRTDGTNFMYVSAENADEAITFADVQGTFVTALGLANVAAGTNRFNSMNGLSAKVASSPGLLSNVEDGTTDAKVNLKINNPLDTISYATGTGPGNFLTFFNIAAGPHGPVYNAAGLPPGNNMASGKIIPQFTRNIRMFDSLGTGHDFRIGFIKSGNNSWLTEVWAVNKTDIVTLDPNAQIANGQITFNGDGSLRSVSSALTNDLTITWANGASPSRVEMNFGTAGQITGTLGAAVFGQTNGLSQFDGAYNVRFARANGAETGNLRGIEFTEDGFIVANYSNGQGLKVYKVPVVDFTNINGLQALDGNVFVQSNSSGEFNLKEPGVSGAGKLAPASLENTNVELAAELTKMIQTQRFYQANTKVITTTDTLLEDLQRIGG